MSLALVAIIFSSISIVANLYVMKDWIVCLIKGHNRLQVKGYPASQCRRCGL